MDKPNSVFIAVLGILLSLSLAAPTTYAASADQQALAVSAMRDRMRGAGDSLPEVAGAMAANYPRQAPEVICTGIHTDSSQGHEIIAAVLASGAGHEQVPPACSCTESDEEIASLVQGAITNGVSAADLSSLCLQEVNSAGVVQSLLADLLGAASRDDFDFILGTTYDVLVDLLVEDADDLLVDTLVDGNFLSFGGVADQCGESCMRPVADTLVQSIVDVQQGGGLASDLVGEPSGVAADGGSDDGEAPGDGDVIIDPEPPASSS